MEQKEEEELKIKKKPTHNSQYSFIFNTDLTIFILF